MFTGIIESIGEIVELNREQSNLHITLRSDFTQELKIDQSLAHDGVCLTVVAIENDNTPSLPFKKPWINRILVLGLLGL